MVVAQKINVVPLDTNDSEASCWSPGLVAAIYFVLQVLKKTEKQRLFSFWPTLVVIELFVMLAGGYAWSDEGKTKIHAIRDDQNAH